MEVSWNPDKTAIIFESDNQILVEKIGDNNTSEIIKITEGNSPDWR
jgi:hypothetical protein